MSGGWVGVQRSTVAHPRIGSLSEPASEATCWSKPHRHLASTSANSNHDLLLDSVNGSASFITHSTAWITAEKVRRRLLYIVMERLKT